MTVDALQSGLDLPQGARHVLLQQSTARERMEGELRAAEDELRAIFDSSPLMAFVVDPDWRVSRANRRVEETSGFPVSRLVGGTTGEALCCLHRLDADGCGLGPACRDCRVRRAISRTLDRGLACRGIDVPLPRDSAGDRVLRISTAPLAAGGRRRALVWAEDKTERVSAPVDAGAARVQPPGEGALRETARDVSGGRRPERSLRESEAALRALVESTRSPIAVLDRERRLWVFNSAFADMMKAAYGVEARAGLCATDPLPPEERDWWLERIEQALEGDFVRDEVVKTVRGEARTYGVSINPVVQRGEVIGVSQFMRDITEQKEADEALRMMSRRLLRAQEDERRRVSRELHDEVGQVLTAVKIGLQRLERRDDAESMAPRVTGSILAVDRAIQDIRRLCLDLRPPLLDEMGLEAAVRAHAEHLTREVGLDIRVSTRDLGSLSLEVEIVCFRVVQEALTNVLRHARARRVAVVVRKDRRRLRIAVIDDGAGFDVTAALGRSAAGQSVGLASMRERVGLLGGRLDIRSAPGAGSRIRVSLPLDVPRALGGPPAGADAR